MLQFQVPFKSFDEYVFRPHDGLKHPKSFPKYLVILAYVNQPVAILKIIRFFF